MKLLLALLTLGIVISSNTCCSQHADTVFIHYTAHDNDSIYLKVDTSIFESFMHRNLLIGTTILSETHNQQYAKGYGLWLNKVEKSNCPKTRGEPKNQNSINSIIQTDTSMIIDVSFTANCCQDFLCDIGIGSGDTLNLITIGYGTNCACTCCYGITFYLDKVLDSEFRKVKGVKLVNE